MRTAIGWPSMRAARVVTVASVLALSSLVSAQGSSWGARLGGPAARATLQHPEPQQRIRAAEILGRSGEPTRAVSALLDALEEEEDLRVRPALFDALARRGDAAAVPRLAQWLGDFDREDRAEALRTIGAIGGESASRVLIEWLAAPDVGDQAAEALRWFGVSSVPELQRALQTPAAAERAARVLGAIGDARATPTLIAALPDAPAPLRIVIFDALRHLGDERAAPTLLAATGDRNEAVASSALRALGEVAGPAFAPAVAQIADRGATALRPIAIESLVALDPALAAPRVLAQLDSPDTPATSRAALARAVVARPAFALVPVLVSLAHGSEHGAAAAEALSRVPRGGGIEALLALAEEDGARFTVPLALVLRRHREVADRDWLERARGALGAGDSLRGAVLLALAGDAAALPRLEEALEADAALDRARAALGLALLGPQGRGAREKVARRVAVEDDPRAFRALALAASSLGASLDVDHLDARFRDPAVAPEALALAAENPPRTARGRQRLRRTMRQALRATDARLRAGAAVALGRAGDRRAWRALAMLLEDEHDAVRLAAARALASLDVREARAVIAARERVERHGAVRRALRTALDTAAAAPPAVLQGRETLFVRVVAAPGPHRAAETIEVDVWLPDGRWIRTFTLKGGEVLLTGLPAGEAEVQVRL